VYRLARFAVAYAVGVCVLLLLPAIVPIEGGPLAIALILSPHLALALVAVLPIAVLARSRSLAIALAIVALLFVSRFGGEWWSPSVLTGDATPTIHVATWNVEAGAQAVPAIMELLNRHPVDLVAIEELTPDVAAAIQGDPHLAARYPYQALFPTPGVAGIGLLSAYPIVSARNDIYPVRIEAELDVGGRAVFVLAAHPFPALISRVAGIPFGLDPAARNDELELLRRRALELDVQHDLVILMGDFNAAPTEPAFRRLTTGLHDAHAEVGVGPGWSWRPARLGFLGIGLLRIDLILSSSALMPVSTSMDCPTVGDHCLVEAQLQIAN
jgi:endonuclease/exonuclease/phosphatase (EEP) superfamily protein YafD